MFAPASAATLAGSRTGGMPGNWSATAEGAAELVGGSIGAVTGELDAAEDGGEDGAVEAAGAGDSALRPCAAGVQAPTSRSTAAPIPAAAIRCLIHAPPGQGHEPEALPVPRPVPGHGGRRPIWLSARAPPLLGT